MLINKVELKGSWGYRFPLLALTFYFFLFFPPLRLVVYPDPFYYQNGPLVYFSLVLLVLLAKLRKGFWESLGFSTQHLKVHVLVGVVAGLMLLGIMPLLDKFLELIHLSQNELFQGQGMTSDDKKMVTGNSIWMAVVMVPVIEQMFFTGFLLQTLIKRIDPILSIYLGGTLFTLAHYTLDLGTFTIGLATCFLFKVTGTIYASMIFHISCAGAGVLLLEVYPRLIPLATFLY